MQFKAFFTLENTILAIILVSTAAKFALIPMNQGMWWDEAVYLGLGRGVMGGHYSMWPGTTIESFRPPLFPLLISPVHFSPLLARLMVASMSMLSVILIYMLSRSVFGRQAALWAALMASVNYYFVFFSTKVLTEPLVIAMISLSLLSFVKWKRGRKPVHILLSGLFIGLSFSVRYLTAMVIISFMLFFAYHAIKERKLSAVWPFFVFTAGCVAGTLPWLILNTANYGSPLQGLFVNFGVYAGSGPSGIPIIGGFLLFFGAMGLAMIPGICSSWDTKSRSMAVLMLLTVMVSLVFYFAFPRQEPRYLLTYLPVFSAFGGLGVHSLVRRLPKGAGETIAVLVIVVSALSAASGLMSVSADTVSASALVSACYEIRNLTAPGDVVVSDSYPYIYYISERKPLQLYGNDREGLLSSMQENGARYVLFYVFENPEPELYREMLGGPDFRKISSYSQWGDPEAAVIYEHVTQRTSL